MKSVIFKKAALAFLFLISCSIKSQLTVNQFLNWRTTTSGTAVSTSQEDWIYDITTLANGNYAVCGYITHSTITEYFPMVAVFSPSGTLIWQQHYTCFQGWSPGYNIFETPNGLVVIGQGARAGGCGEHQGVFSIRVDPNNGTIDPIWGVKIYNDHSVPLGTSPQNSATAINLGIGTPKACSIKSGTSIIGYMICGSLDDNCNPGIPEQYSTGGYLLKLDGNGYPDMTFGNSGVSLIEADAPNSSWKDTHFNNVCVNYDNSGNVDGYLIAGYQNETPTVAPAGGRYGVDAVIFVTDASSSLTYINRFDESTQHKESPFPFSISYTDLTDYTVCPNSHSIPLARENSNESAYRISQISNGGEFIVVCQFDWVPWCGNSGTCSPIYPSTIPGYVGADPAVLRVNASAGVVWKKNAFQSSGADFENELLISGSGDVIVLGVTNAEPQGAPTMQQVVISKFDTNGNFYYNYVYTVNTNGQMMFCPFAMDWDGAGNIIIAGDNELNGDDMQLLNIGY